MSLINEALKRAKQSHSRQAIVATPNPPLQPVLQSPVAANSNAWRFRVGAVAVLVLGCWLLFLSWRQSQNAQQARIPVAKTVAQAGANARSLSNATSAPAVAATLQPPLTTNLPSLPPITGPDLVSAQATGTTPIAAQEAAEPALDRNTNELDAASAELDPDPPAFQLQGIFYRQLNASALIDGQALFVGDEIGGATVDTIERRSVRLLKDGKSIVLNLR